MTVLFHILYSTGFAYLLASLFGHLSPSLAVVALIFGWVLGSRHGRDLDAQDSRLKLKSFSPGATGAMEVLIGIVVFYAAFRHFVWLMFPFNSSLMTLNVSNLGDLPLHINYIKAMASGAKFPILNPEYALEPLRYPFGIDLYNSLWQTLGVPIQSHLFVVGVLLTAVTLVVLRWFGGWWAMGALFLSGGLAGLNGLHFGLSSQQLVDWKNIFLTVFITQRGIMVAIPVGLLIIDFWRRHVSQEIQLTRSVKSALGLVWGMLSLFHAHAFMAVSIILVLISFIEAGVSGVLSLLKSRLFKFALIPGFFFTWQSTDGFHKASVIRWGSFLETPVAGSEGLMRLAYNFGFWLLIPFAIALAIQFRSAQSERGRKFLRLFTAVSLFLFFMKVIFAPWGWDNIKLLIWPYLLLAQLANETIDPYLSRWARYPIAALLFASGLIAMAASLGAPTIVGTPIYHNFVLNEAEGALKGMDPNAVFIAEQGYNHPLTYFGRFRVLGYDGHLYSHAINSLETTQKQEAVLRGDKNWLKTARELHATHIYWSNAEKAAFGDQPRPWMTELENVSRAPGVAIYRIPSESEKK